MNMSSPVDEIVIKQMPQEQRMKFYACVGGTMAIVLVGWALTMRDQILQVSFVAQTPVLQEVKEGVAQITAEVKANTDAPAAELEAAMGVIIEPMMEGVEQRQEAQGIVSEIMVESLQEEVAE